MWLRCLILALVLVSPIAAATFPPESTSDAAAFLVSDHRTGLKLYEDTHTNGTASFNSKLRGFESVRVFVIGEGLTYNLTDKLGNFSAVGVTNASLSSWSIYPNGSAAWPFLTLSNVSANYSETFNFGVVSFTKDPVTVSEPATFRVLSFVEYLKRELRTLLLTGVVFILLTVSWWVFATRYKRGTVREW